MSEIKEIHSYLDKMLKKLENKIEQLPPEIISQAESFADNLDYEYFLEALSLQEHYKKETFKESAHIAHITNLALLFKAKRSFSNGEIKNTIDFLFTYILQIGQIDQYLTDTYKFREKEAKRSKTGTDKLHETDRKIRKKVCELLQEHKPTNGWENRSVATKTILPDIKEFHRKHLSGSSIKPENLEANIRKWMENRNFEPYQSFKDTASDAWIKLYTKANDHEIQL